MFDRFTEEEQNEIRVAVAHLERMNNAKANEVLEVVDLFSQVIEDQDAEIESLKEQLEDRKRYIEEYGLH